MNFDAFISYSSKDKPTADAACAALEAAGIRCWIAPRDILPGSDWGASILDALDQCRVLVLIFSTSANNSPQIRREVERVVNRGIPVLPVRIENIEPTKAMAFFMGPVHWLDALTPPLEQHLARLAASIKTLLEVDEPQPQMHDPGHAPPAHADRRTKEAGSATPRAGVMQPSTEETNPPERGEASHIPDRTAQGQELREGLSRTGLRNLRIILVVVMAMGACIAGISLYTRDAVNFAAAVMLTGICYWFVYRNLVANQTTARIAALTIAGILCYFIVMNIMIGVLTWVIIETVAAAGLFFVFAELQRLSQRRST